MTSATALCPSIPHLLPPNLNKPNHLRSPPSRLARAIVSVSRPRKPNETVRSRWRAGTGSAAQGGFGESTSAKEEEEDHAALVVVNFYKFVRIDNPHSEVARHVAFLEVLAAVFCSYLFNAICLDDDYEVADKLLHAFRLGTIIVGQSLSNRIEDHVDGVWEKSVQERLFKEFYAIELMHLALGLLEVELTGDLIGDLDVRGRIYLSEQGINAQYSGPRGDALCYVEWLKEDSKFSDILVQISPAPDGHAFPRLKVQLRPLVQVEGGISHLPLVDPSLRATPLSPSDWKKQIEAVNDGHCASSANENSSVVILDLRNGYEWDIGHFHGAMRPEVDCFRSTSFGLSKSQVCSSDPLVDADKDKTSVFMYCTGGIRCDVYSTILREKGFKNLYTLKGGVSHYLEKEGSAEWVGNLFVFDSRLSLPPAAFGPQCSAKYTCSQQFSMDDKFARCYTCGSVVDELRHRNCANLDCNVLFLCCPECLHSLRGCCSRACRGAPRLRPLLPGRQRYEKWHLYRDMKVQV